MPQLAPIYGYQVLALTSLVLVLFLTSTHFSAYTAPSKLASK